MDNETNKKKFWTTQSITLWIYSHFVILLSLILIPVVLLVAWVSWNEWESKKDNQISGDLYLLQKTLEDASVKANGDDYKKSSNQLADLLNKKKKKPSVYSDEMKTAAEKYEAKIRSVSTRKSTLVFVIDLAHFYKKFNKKEKAISLLSLFAHPQKKSILYSLVTFQLINHYMDNQDCDKGTPLLEGLLKNKRAQLFHNESSFQLAICYEKKAKYEEAKKIYNQLLAESKDDFSRKKIKDYLYLLKLKEKLKK